MAKLPLCVLKADRDSHAKTHDYEHPAYKILRYRFNPYMVSMLGKRVLTMHAVSEGNGYGYILRDGAGRPLEIWPLSPMKTYPVREEREDGSGGRLYYVTQIGSNTTKQQRKLRSEDVLHLKGLSFDGLVGYSAVAKMREALGLALAYENFGSIHFRNNARPGIILKHPGRLKPDAKQNLRESWERMHSGLENAHRTAVLEDGMDAVMMDTNLRNSQLLEGKAFSRVQIANFFGVPPHKVGAGNNASYNSLEQENESYADDGGGLGYWLPAWEGECWEKLLTEAEKDELTHLVEFQRKGLIRSNLATRTTYYTNLLDRGVLSPDEVRGEEGYNPRPDGKGGDYMTSVQVQQPGQGGEDGKPLQGGGKPPPGPAKKKKKKDKGDDGRARLLLADTLGRMVRRIGVHVRRAATKPAEFLSRLDAVYEEHRGGLADMLAPVLYAIGSPVPAAEVVGPLLADFHRDALAASECRANDLAEAADSLCRKWEACAPASYADNILSRAKPDEPARTTDQALEILSRLPDDGDGEVTLTMPVDEDPPYDLDPKDLAGAKTKAVLIRELVATRPTVKRGRIEDYIKDPDAESSGKNLPDDLPKDLPYVIECEGLQYIFDGHHRLMARQLLGYGKAQVYYYQEDKRSRPFERFDPNQPRDPDGKWGEGGGAAGGFADHKAANEWAKDKVVTQGGVSAEEGKAFATYTSKGYESINNALREGKEPAGAAAKAVAHMDAVIARSETKEDATVQRGFNIPGGFKAMKGMVGGTFEDKGFVSTTLDKNTARKFAWGSKGGQEPVIAEIHVPKGSKAAYVGTMAGVKDKKESELVLPRGSRFKVESTRMDGAMMRVKMTLLGPGDGAGKASARAAAGTGDRWTWGDGDLVPVESQRDFNPDQPRDPDGKWGSGGGAGSDKLHEAAGEKAKTLTERIKDLPAKVATAARDKVASVYGKLADRYGKATAVAIIGAGLLGVPVPAPGASLVTAAPVLAAAELYRRFKGGKRSDDDKDYTDDELKKLGKEWMDDLVDDWKKNDVPKLETE